VALLLAQLLFAITEILPDIKLLPKITTIAVSLAVP
jgi:hypothetical protein